MPVSSLSDHSRDDLSSNDQAPLLGRGNATPARDIKHEREGEATLVSSTANLVNTISESHVLATTIGLKLNRMQSSRHRSASHVSSEMSRRRDSGVTDPCLLTQATRLRIRRIDPRYNHCPVVRIHRRTRAVFVITQRGPSTAQGRFIRCLVKAHVPQARTHIRRRHIPQMLGRQRVLFNRHRQLDASCRLLFFQIIARLAP